MTATGARPLLRWSSTRDCPRKAVYEATGAPARDLYENEQRRLFRGKRIGRDYAEILSHTHNTRDDHRKFIRAQHRSIQQGGGYYGAGQVWCEKKVVWPLGVGHIDIWLPHTAAVVEVLSSASASDAMVRSKLLQLVGYLEHDPEAQRGALVVVDPADYSEERILVSPASSTYADLVGEMRERIRQLQAWDETGELPPRVCGKPQDARQHFCRYADHCFDGWQPPERDQIGDELVRDLAARLESLKTRERTAKAPLAELEQERKQVEQQLAELVPAGKWAVGPYELVRTTVQRKPTFQWERAELAGRFDPDGYGEFFKPGAVYDTWKVERVLSAAAADAVDEFGDEVPF